ncbi:MAG TPA: pirin family protein [Clostridiaceae bacterium]|nr:pirin family protein [Clostridiaceae bacterium]
MERKIKKKVQGFPTVDGAGVKLIRVLGNKTVQDFDPFLMLDSFDSDNPDDYIAGFPMHPHRGIETISYVYQGGMVHRDSLGHEDAISDGEVQWMTAGSGILHEETLPAAERMLGVQLWLNLAARDKMVAPAYISIKNDAIPEVSFSGGFLRVLAGSYGDVTGHQAQYQPLDYYDIHLEAESSLIVDTHPDRTVVLFTIEGDARIGGERVAAKTAVLCSPGEQITVGATEAPAQVLFMSAPPLNEPVVWGGPIVMNTRSELQQAFAELEDGTFLQKEMTYNEET